MCTDVALSMIGKYNVFLDKVREKNSDVSATHCFLHRKMQFAKTVPHDLKKVLDTSVKMIKFIKS